MNRAGGEDARALLRDVENDAIGNVKRAFEFNWITAGIADPILRQQYRVRELRCAGPFDNAVEVSFFEISLENRSGKTEFAHHEARHQFSKGFAQEYSATAAVNAVAYHVHVAINSHALAGLLGAMFGRGAQKSNDDRMRGPL